MQKYDWINKIIKIIIKNIVYNFLLLNYIILVIIITLKNINLVKNNINNYY